MIQDSVYWHCLRKIPGMGHQKLDILLSRFPDGKTAWEANATTYRHAELTDTLISTIENGKRDIDPDEESNRLEEEQIEVLLKTNPSFPPLLREIPRPPVILYVRGTIKDWSTRKYISIVGSRRFTSYGERVATRLSEDLTRAGFTIVSGLAFGIDSIAHDAALRAGGETVSILGGSIDDASIAPVSHLPLAREVMRHGSLLADYPPPTPPAPGTFPARNRLIAGISVGTIVVEAAEKSGSLITATLALDFNREVFSVPGSIFSPTSTGTNTLIRNGAKIVRSISDILEEFGSVFVENNATSNEKKKHRNLSLDEETIYALLSHESTPIDGIIKSSHCKASIVSSALTMLEIKGLVKNIGGNNYIRV